MCSRRKAYAFGQLHKLCSKCVFHCRLFIDGQLMGEVSGPGSDGGGPTVLNGSIVLCGRSNGDPDSFFDGSMAYLGRASCAPQHVQLPQHNRTEP